MISLHESENNDNKLHNNWEFVWKNYDYDRVTI